MNRSKHSWFFALAILILGAATSVAQSRVQLVQGRRAVKDKVTFVVEVAHEKNQNPRYATAPEDMQIFTRFADHPATGMVYVDGKALGRFDESISFNSNLVDVTYGQHAMTLVFASPAIVTDFYVTIRGGIAHEILEGESAVSFPPTGLDQRLVELERKVQELEAEMATLKKKGVQ